MGLVMTADSLRGIPAVSITVKGQNRGTITNEQGVFSIVVMKGDKIEFTSIGYKPKLVEISRDLEGNQQSIIQLLVTDTLYLPATIIKPRPTREQFERDFVNTKVPDDEIESSQAKYRRNETQDHRTRTARRCKGGCELLPETKRKQILLSGSGSATEYFQSARLGEFPPGLETRRFQK